MYMLMRTPAFIRVNIFRNPCIKAEWQNIIVLISILKKMLGG